MDLKIFTACNCIIEKVCWRCGCCWGESERAMNIYLVFCCYFDGRNMMLLMLVINTPPPSLALSSAHSPCVTLVLSHHCGSTCGALFPSSGVRPLVSLLLVCDIGRVFLLSRALASIRVYYNFSSHDVIARYV